MMIRTGGSRAWRGAIPFVVIASVFLGGCGEGEWHPEDHGALFDTLDGHIMVQNPERGRWEDGEQWRVVEEFRWGSGEDLQDHELLINDLATVTLGPHGQIFILQYSSSDVVVLTGDGRFLRRIGRFGRGPGELSHPHAMVFDDEARLWVVDRGNRRYQVYDSIGQHQMTSQRNVTASNTLQYPLFFDSEGCLIDETGRDNVAYFLRHDTLGSPPDTLFQHKKPPIPAKLKGVPFRPSHQFIRYVSGNFFPRLRWSLGPDLTVWFATTGELRLTQRSLTGDTLRVVTTSHRGGDLTRKDRQIITKGLREVGLGWDDIVAVRPVLDQVRVMDDGHVLVGVVDEVGEDTSVFDVFSPEGVFLGTVDLGFTISRRSVPAFIGDTILAVTKGEHDVPILVRARFERNPH